MINEKIVMFCGVYINEFCCVCFCYVIMSCKGTGWKGRWWFNSKLYLFTRNVVVIIEEVTTTTRRVSLQNRCAVVSMTLHNQKLFFLPLWELHKNYFFIHYMHDWNAYMSPCPFWHFKQFFYYRDLSIGYLHGFMVNKPIITKLI